MSSPTMGMWACRHGVDGRDWCDQCGAEGAIGGEPWPIQIMWCSDGPGCRICIAQSKAEQERIERETGVRHPIIGVDIPLGLARSGRT